MRSDPRPSKKPQLGAFVAAILLLLLLWIRAIHESAVDQQGFFLSLIAVWILGIILLYRLSRGWGESNGKTSNGNTRDV